MYAKQKHPGCKKSARPIRSSIANRYVRPKTLISVEAKKLLIKNILTTVQLSTKFTKTRVSSGVPRQILKITRGLFSNARVLQRTYKYFMHVSSARE